MCQDQGLWWALGWRQEKALGGLVLPVCCLHCSACTALPAPSSLSAVTSDLFLSPLVVQTLPWQS